MAAASNPSLIGRYEVVGRLGRGGMGVVYRGRDPRIGRHVAIKLLHVSDEDLRERFLQEAQSAGNLKHPNIVTIYDFGEHDGQPYIVMEYVEGVTLADEIRARPVWPVRSKLDLIEALSRGLDYAHGRGIVHRDVKPANLMIDHEGVLKILDFGIARVSDSGLTQVGMLMGTPHYMSPEQIEGRRVDRRSDIFAVGLVMYELLTGERAFPGDTAHVVMSRILRGAPPAIEALCPGLDHSVIAIVHRAIQKDPQKRYQTLAALAADVVKVRSQLARRVESVDPATARMPTPPPVTPAARQPRPGINRDALSKLRSDRIDAHVRSGREALAAGDYAAAAAAGEQAALMDPDDTRVLDLLEEVRDATAKQQAREWLDEAGRCLERQDLDRARELVEQAAQIDPDAIQTRELQAAVDEALRRREEETRRREAIVAALERARASLADGRLESAIRSASEILIEDPANAEARHLTEEAISALEARRLREREAAAARTVAEQQKREFARGRRREAIAALERAAPHDLITATLAELRAELEVQERKAREEAERLQREQAEAAARKQAEIADHLARAAAARRAGRLADASAAIDAVLRLDPGNAEAQDRRRVVEAALAEEQRAAEETRRRAEEARAAIRRARSALSARDFDGALKAVDEAAALDPENADLQPVRIAAQAGAEEVRRAAELERGARAAVAESERRFAAGERVEALESLERFTPEHPVVSAALVQLRARFDEIRRGQEAEERHRRRVRQADDLVAQGRAALESHDAVTAAKLADQALSLVPDSRDAQSLKNLASEAVDQARRREAEDRRARAEAERTVRQRRIQEQLDSARAEATSGQFDDALIRLRRLRQSEGQVEGLARLLEEIQAAQAISNRVQAWNAAGAAPAGQARPRDTSSAEASTVITPPPSAVDAPAPGKGVRWSLVAGATAVVALAIVAAVMWNNSAVDRRGGPSTPTTIATTSIPVVNVATSSVPPTVDSTPSPAVTRAISATRRFLREGNLQAAAREVVAGLGVAPADAELIKLADDVMNAAAQHAADSRGRADRAGAKSKPQYGIGVNLTKLADSSRQARRPEPAVRDYVAAAGHFTEAMKESTQVALTTTTVPVVPAPTTISTTTTSSSIRSTAPTTSVATTSIVPTISRDQVMALLNEYSAAYQKFDDRRMFNVFPSFPDSERQTMETDKKYNEYCRFEFGKFEIASQGESVRAEGEAVKICKPNTRQPESRRRNYHMFDLRRNPDGSVVIFRHTWN